MRKCFVQQGIGQLFSAGKDREATEILVDHIMLVSPDADRLEMLQYREFDESGKLGRWNLNYCNISKLPSSFGALVCSGSLDLQANKFGSLPESFSEIIVAGCLYLRGNPHLTGYLRGNRENFANVKGKVWS